MSEQSSQGIHRKCERVAATIIFSAIMAVVSAFIVILLGIYLSSHFGRPANDPDDTIILLCSVLLGAVVGIGVGLTSLWKYWPRAG